MYSLSGRFRICEEIDGKDFALGKKVLGCAHTREDQSLFGIVQGSMYPELRKMSADALAKWISLVMA